MVRKLVILMLCFCSYSKGMFKFYVENTAVVVTDKMLSTYLMALFMLLMIMARGTLHIKLINTGMVSNTCDKHNFIYYSEFSYLQ